MAFVEIFPFEFYRMVPEGVTLVIATTHPIQTTSDGDGLERAHATAGEMVQAGVSVIVFGGATPSYTLGFDRLDQFTRSIEKEFGVPATTAVYAQRHALETVGARRVGVVTPFGNTGGGDRIEDFGFEVVGVNGAGIQQVDFGRVPTDTPAQVARELAREHPEVDTLFFPAAHWPAASNIDALETELGLNVVTSAQAIVWEGLRRSGVSDPIQGYGRLLREH
jgi:maleate isomerase